MLKRLFDIVVSFCGLVVQSPFLLVFMLLQEFNSPSRIAARAEPLQPLPPPRAATVETRF